MLMKIPLIGLRLLMSSRTGCAMLIALEELTLMERRLCRSILIEGGIDADLHGGGCSAGGGDGYAGRWWKEIGVTPPGSVMVASTHVTITGGAAPPSLAGGNGSAG